MGASIKRRVLCMSNPATKGVKRPSTRPANSSASPAPAAKARAVSVKPAKPPQKLAKRPLADKAPVRNAANAIPSTATNTGKPPTPKREASSKKPVTPAATKPAKTAAVAKSRPKAAPPPSKVPVPSKAKSTKAPAKSSARPVAHAPVVAAKSRSTATSPNVKPAPARPAAAPRSPTVDEAAALRAFERAHREFIRGHFAEARQLFRALVEQHPNAAEYTARARTYLAVAEARLRTTTAPALPRDGEALYDRGVLELNRGDYVAAQEMFERAARHDPEAAHIHYSLAAARSRLGSAQPALQALARALTLQPTLRARAQHDPDMAALRNEPAYEQLIYPSHR